MPEPRANIPINSSFIYFKPQGLKDGFKVIHKVDRGFVDLEFSGQGNQIDQLKERYKPLLKPGMIIERTKKSAVVRIVIEEINLHGSFEQQKDKIITAIEAAKKLNNWAQEIGVA